MSDKKKIVLIYASVAVLAILLIFGFALIRELEDLKLQAKREQASNDTPIAENVGRAKADLFLQLEKDITLTNQDGQEVSIYDLKEKTWVFAQFFAKCPMCAERNYTDLLAIYKQYKDNPDFMIVCMTVDPETDNIEKLTEYASAVNAETDSWWFLTGEQEKMHAYMSEQIQFMDIRKRTVQADIAAHGLYAHDLGLAVFDKGLKMRVKRDLAFARAQSPEMLQAYENDIHTAIKESLAK